MRSSSVARDNEGFRLEDLLHNLRVVPAGLLRGSLKENNVKPSLEVVEEWSGHTASLWK